MNAQEFYKGQLISPTTGATLLALTMDPKFLNSSKREGVMQEILGHAERFQKKTGIKMHYAGLPYVRATMTTKVASEMKLFVALTVVMMALTLFMFFRTWSAVVLTPSSVRSRFSSRTFRLNGSFSAPSTAARRKIVYSVPDAVKLALASKLFWLLTVSSSLVVRDVALAVGTDRATGVPRTLGCPSRPTDHLS